MCSATTPWRCSAAAASVTPRSPGRASSARAPSSPSTPTLGNSSGRAGSARRTQWTRRRKTRWSASASSRTATVPTSASRAGSTSMGSCRRRSASRTWKTRSTRWNGAKCCAPSSPSSEPMIELVTTAGVFSLDGQDFDVENNIWLIGDDHEVLVVDAAHDTAPIATAVGDRMVRAILCTHGHNDHINAADELSRATGGAPVLLHPDDEMLWDVVYPDRKPDRAVRDGDELDVAGERLRIVHTPGHSP